MHITMLSIIHHLNSTHRLIFCVNASIILAVGTNLCQNLLVQSRNGRF